MTGRRPFYFSVFAFGFTGMAVQVLLMRELLVVFYGNELSSGIMLASWLLWVSAGSFAARFKKFEEEIFHIFLLSIAIIAPATIYLIRNIRNILGVSPGEIIGLLPMALSTFTLLAPACIIFGCLFAMSCRFASREPVTDAAPAASPAAVGKIYMIESLGAAGGGLAFNFLLVYALSPLQIALFCGILNIFAVLIIADRRRAPFRWGITFAFMCLAAAFIFYGSRPADFRIRQMQWKGFYLVAVKDSKYGNIALTKLKSQFNLFENGLLTAAANDTLTAEESVHYALLEHPAPKRILLIGGALNGALDEVLKQPVESVDCVELDPATTELAKEKYPASLLKGFEDKRAKIHYLDGRLFVKNLARIKNPKYDVIILTLPNPYTAQINRFYSLEFYRQIRGALEARGLFSFGVSSSADYISSEEAEFLGCLYKTLKEEFADIKILPGYTAFFFASPSRDLLTYDYKILEGRIKERDLNLNFVNEHYLPDKFDPMRIDYLENAVRSAGRAKINRDFRPIGYFYDMVLWSARFDPRLKDLLKKMNGVNPIAIAVLLLAAYAVLSIFRRLSKKAKKLAVALSVGTTGFSTMLIQIITILAFQAVYGYVYNKIGIIFASFMLGLVCGSLTAVRLIEKNCDLAAVYRRLQLALCAYCFALPFLFRFRNPAAGEIIFLLLPAVAGLIGGVQFPLANRICAGNEKDAGKTAGILYGIDLLGACAGALITSVVLIPILGINSACYLTGLLNFFVLVYLYISTQISHISFPH